MYTATMEYFFKPEKLSEAAQIWKDEVMNHAVTQPGFIRMQFLSQKNGTALAMGTWRSKEDAETFMRTGVFKNLLAKISGLSVAEPKPHVWELVHFSERN